MIARAKLNDINYNSGFAAAEMLEAGFNILPLEPEGKKPAFELLENNSTKEYLNSQVEWETVKNWLNEGVNIGIAAGVEVEPEYKLIIIDLDKKPKKLGFPITPIVETARGYHIYFKCRADKLPSAHKTARGEIKTSGYVVAPPSVHESGKQYIWADYLSFVDVPLADFNDRRDQFINYLEEGRTEPENKQQKQADDKLNTTINTNKKITDQRNKNKEMLINASKDEEIAFQIMNNVFNVKVDRVGKSFKCPIHKEKQPSAALYRTDNGTIGFKDFHMEGAFFTLPEAYFYYKNGKQKRLKGATSLIWWIRLLVNAKVLKVPSIAPPKPLDKLSDNQKQLYKGLIELLEVQQAYDPNQVGAPFSHRFAADWVNMNYNSVCSAKRQLSKKHYFYKIEAGSRTTRKAGKWNIWPKSDESE